MTVATRQRAASLLQPNQAAGLQLWLKADAIGGLADGDPVATWADLSGNANDLTQGTAGSRPTWQTGEVNGLPVVRFDGTDDHLFRTSAVVGSGSFTTFIVVKFAALTAGTTFLGIRRSSASQPILSGFRILTNQIKADWRNDANNLTTLTPSPTLSTGTVYLVSQRKNGTAFNAWLNAGSLASGTTAAGTTTLDRTAVGAEVSNTVGAYLSGDVCEVAIYNTAIGDERWMRLARGLGAKWGIPIG